MVKIIIIALLLVVGCAEKPDHCEHWKATIQAYEECVEMKDCTVKAYEVSAYHRNQDKVVMNCGEEL